MATSHSKNFYEEVLRWGLLKQTMVSLRGLKDFVSDTPDKNLLISAQFLKKELLIRIARQVILLDSLPYGLSNTTGVWEVRERYLDSFRELRRYSKIKDTRDANKFSNNICLTLMRDMELPFMMGFGVQQWKTMYNYKDVCKNAVEIHPFLDQFHLSRIGLRMLMGHHLECNCPILELRFPGYEVVGFTLTHLSPMDVVSKASKAARDIFCRRYSSAPDVQVSGDQNFTFRYVSEHLESMVFRLVMNSLRAVQEHRSSRKRDDEESLPIRIIVVDGGEDLIIQILDSGVGIPSSILPKLYTYLYTTGAHLKDYFYVVRTRPASVPKFTLPITGYGCDLPITRLYARYFGGDMQIDSVEGSGTRVQLHLPRLGDSQEQMF